MRHCKRARIAKNRLVIGSMKISFLLVTLVFAFASCRQDSLSKRYYQIENVKVLGKAPPSMEKIITINNGHRLDRIKSKADFLVAPTRGGYKILIESEEPITSDVVRSIFQQVANEIR